MAYEKKHKTPVPAWANALRLLIAAEVGSSWSKKAEIAEQIGVSTQTIDNYLKGRYELAGWALIHLCALLNIVPTRLVSKTKKQKSDATQES